MAPSAVLSCCFQPPLRGGMLLIIVPDTNSRSAPYAAVFKPGLVQEYRIVLVPSVKNNRLFHEFLDAAEIRVTERLPFRDQDHGVGAIERAVFLIPQFQLAAVEPCAGEFALGCRHG